VQFSYNANGTLGTIVDAAGRETSLSYNGDGLVATIRLADGRTARFQYDAGRTLARATDFQGIASSYTYDPDGRMVRMVVGEDRKTTAFAYTGGMPGAQISTVTGRIALALCLSPIRSGTPPPITAGTGVRSVSWIRREARRCSNLTAVSW
jgi:YD repeat-containing protein